MSKKKYNQLKKQVRLNRIWLPNDVYDKIKALSVEYTLDISDVLRILTIKAVRQNPEQKLEVV